MRLSPMPDSWQRLPLEAVLSKILDHRGKTPKKLGADFAPDGIKVASAKNVSGGRLDLTADVRFVSDDLYRKWMSVPLVDGDVLLTSEAPLGEVALLRDPGPLVLGQRLFALRADPLKLDSRFLFYTLRSPVEQARLGARATGTTAEGIRQTELRKVEIDLPPLDEQRAIAGLLSSLEGLVEANNARDRVVEETFVAAFEHFCASAAATGETTTLGDLGHEIRKSVSPGDVVDGTPYIGLEHMARGRIVLDAWGTSADVNSNKHQFQRGDLLFGKLRPYFRKAGVALVDGICSSDIVVVTPKVERSYGALLGTLASQDFVDAVSAGANGTRMPRTSWHDMARYPIPSLSAEQSSRLSEVARSGADLFAAHVVENRHLIELRNALIPALCSGDLEMRSASSSSVEALP
jgi:type I restriction enzyme S subunit